MSNEVDAQVTKSVLAALANPKFKWRTIQGVSKETGLPLEKVFEAITVVSDKIVKSTVPSTDGQELYATREHFRDTGTATEKLLGAIKNRVL